jgi:tetratricopeptide (TPR) repeat protein
MQAINSLPLDYAPQSLYNMLGQSLGALGRLQEAETWYNKALEVKVDHVPAILTLAGLHAKTGRTKSAKQLFEKAISLNPNATDPYTHYGQFLHKVGDLSAAAAQFGQAAGLAPDSYDIIYNAGNYYREAKMYENAEKYYREALKLNPKVLLHIWFM